MTYTALLNWYYSMSHEFRGMMELDETGLFWADGNGGRGYRMHYILRSRERGGFLIVSNTPQGLLDKIADMAIWGDLMIPQEPVFTRTRGWVISCKNLRIDTTPIF